MKTLINKNGMSWTQKELKKVVGSLNSSPDDMYIRMRCPFNETHKAFSLNESTATGQLTISPSCHGCCAKIDMQNPDWDREKIIAESEERIYSWLKQRELVDGRWAPHSNPFDLQGDSPVLTYLQDVEGSPLLYNSAIHILYGKPGTLKSWLGLSTLANADVRLWDFENGPFGTKDRLEKMQTDYEKCNGYLVPQSADEIYERVREYVETEPDIVVIDGFSGLAEMLEINPESNNEVMTIFNKVLFPLRRAGICVLVLDHLPKDASSEDFPIGAQAKKAQSDVSILVKQKSGSDSIEMLVAKDRFGQLSRRCEDGSLPKFFGKVHLKEDEGIFRVEVTPAYQAEIEGSDYSTYDANQMQDIWSFVEKNPKCSKGDIETGVIGKHDRKRKNIQRLVDDGYISSNKVATAIQHEVLKPLQVKWSPLGA